MYDMKKRLLKGSYVAYCDSVSSQAFAASLRNCKAILSNRYFFLVKKSNRYLKKKTVCPSGFVELFAVAIDELWVQIAHVFSANSTCL